MDRKNDKKNKTNSNNSIFHLKISSYPIQNHPLKMQLKNFFEVKPRKNSLFMLARFEKQFSRFRNITQEQVIKLLSKDKKTRIDVENRMIADYLTSHFDYFYQIKNSNRDKFLKLISVLNFENILSDTIIINIGEENNNFYIIFEGSVTIYRHYNYNKDMKFSEFCQYLKKEKKQSEEEYKRILKNNAHLDLDIEDIMNDQYYYMSLKNKIFNVHIEELEEVGTYTEGFSFGELSLMSRKNKDIMIKSATNCKLIYVSKFDFNRILRTIEEKRLEKKASFFKKSFPIFKLWTMEQLITLFNYCSQEIFHSEEFIFKQNDENEYIYFVEEGNIIQFTNVSFSWYLEFMDYINDCNGNLLKIIKHIDLINFNLNSGESHKTVQNIIGKVRTDNINNKKYEKYRFFKIKDIYLKRKDDFITINELCNKKNGDTFIKLKFEENDINNPEKIYKIPLFSSEKPVILGLDEVFDLKRKFTTVGCISGQVKVKKIKIIDLLIILYHYREFNYIDTFIDFILQKKSILCKTIKSHLQKIGINFEKKMNDKYDNIINQPLAYKKNSSKSIDQNNKIKNEILLATKLKTWNEGSYLDNVLDTSLHLINPKSSRQIKLKKIEKYQKLMNLFKEKRTPNEKLLFSTKNFFSKIFIKKPNRKLKIKSLDKKENYIDKFFRTSIYPKKKANKSRNIKFNIEEKKNDDKIYLRTVYNCSYRKNQLLEHTQRIIGPNNLKTNYMNPQSENKPIKKKPFKLINYKVTEDYFDSIKDNNTDDLDDQTSYLSKEKEKENVMSLISTNDKEKEKAKNIIRKISNKDLIKKNFFRNVLQNGNK